MKEEFVLVSRRKFSFGLFNFLGVFLLHGHHFLNSFFSYDILFHRATFITLVRIFAKLAFFKSVFSLSGGLTSRSWNIVQVSCLFWLINFAGMFTFLFSSITSIYCLAKSQVRFPKKTFCQRIVSIISFIKKWCRV